MMKWFKAGTILVLCLACIGTATGCKFRKAKPDEMASVIPNVSVATVAVDGYSETETESGTQYKTEDYSFCVPSKWKGQYKTEYDKTHGGNFSFYDAKSYNANRKDDSLLFDLGAWPSKESAYNEYKEGEVVYAGSIIQPGQSPQVVIVHYPDKNKWFFNDEKEREQAEEEISEVVDSFQAEGDATFIPAEEETEISAQVESSVVEQSQAISPPNNSIPPAYAYVLNAYMEAFPWPQDTDNIVPEVEGESYLYRFYNNMDDVGYCIMDIDQNGQPELLIGSGTEVFDAFTLLDEQSVMHLFDSGERYLYSYCSDGRFYFHGSSGASNSIVSRYALSPDGKSVVVEDAVAYDLDYAIDMGWADDYTSDEDFWFSTPTGEEADYTRIDEETALARIQSWENMIVAPPYQPLSSAK